jgi:ABC-type transport system involved in multi-copper enzyme maturation permease subunit
MSTVLPEPRWFQVGPHGFFDLVRLARSGRSASVRVAYIVVLFAALAVAFYNSTPPDSRKREESINWNAKIAERFSATILVMQNIAVLVLTPFYMAASIQEERDKGTFPLLFTTHLTAREIILGKWLSRCIQVGAVLLAGLPVLAVAQLWGGIDMPMIAANFCNTALTLATVGALSLFIAIQNRSMLIGVGKTYFVLASFFAVCVGPSGCCTGLTLFLLTPVGDGADGYFVLWLFVGMLAAVHGGIIVWMLQHATLHLESLRQEDTPRVRVEPGINRRLNRFWRWPPISPAAVAWKECYLDRTILHIAPYVLLAQLAFLLIAHATGVASERGSRSVDLVAGDSSVVLRICVGAYTLLVSVRLTGCIVRERQQRTLETLLTVPILPREFLFQKFVGNLKRHWLWLLPAGGAWLILLLFGRDWLAVGLLLPMVMAVDLAFFAVLGLSLSVFCRSALSAYLSFGFVVLLLALGIPLFMSFLGLTIIGHELWIGISPVLSWYTITTTWNQAGRPGAAEIIVSTAVYAVVALNLWMWACRRFARDPIGG